MDMERLFRVIIVGDTGVGKSCLLLRFSEDRFNENHDVTIGVEFGTRTLKIDDQAIKLQIWDTAGQESYRSITRSFYRRADGVILVYDVTARHTFENCKHWMDEIKQNTNSDVVIYLIGNQADLVNTGQNQEVSASDAEAFVRSNNLSGFMETSAKSGINVDKAFSAFCKVLYNSWKDKRDIDPTSKSLNVVDLKKTEKKRSKKCC